MKVHIADDHVIIYEGVKVLLEAYDIEVVGHSFNGKQVIEWFKNNEADVLIMDYRMPEMDGGDVLEYFVANNIEQKVLIVSEYAHYNFIKHAINNDASGYILKTEAHELLVNALEKIHSGHFYFSDYVKDIIIGYESGHKKDDTPFEDKLSSKQKEILRLMLQNFSNTEIVEKLNMDDATLRTHTKRMREKVNVKTNVGLVTLAIKEEFK
ncbi:response regulator transcription factor [Tenacibaculum sp. 190524A02b]|uniref:response regulator transcription factor n=1 Tax=Tenacibaculum vairaonense TaxID=3137860 RepID=UPI0031FBA25B